MDIFWWMQIIAACLYLSILLVSIFNLWLIKKKYKHSATENVDKVESILHSYIEPLISGVLFAIVFLNIVPHIYSRFVALKILKSMEKVVFNSNFMILIVFSVISLGNIMIRLGLKWLKKDDDKEVKDPDPCNRWIIFLGLGLHSSIEGFNIGIQKNLLTAIFLAVLTGVHEVLLLPLIILKTFPQSMGEFLNRYEALTMALYTSCFPIGIVTGSLLMNMKEESIAVPVVLIITAGIILYTVLTSNSPFINGNSKDTMKRTVLFNMALLITGLLSYIRTLQEE